MWGIIALQNVLEVLSKHLLKLKHVRQCHQIMWYRVVHYMGIFYLGINEHTA